jgi:hypothetical protein
LTNEKALFRLLQTGRYLNILTSCGSSNQSLTCSIIYNLSIVGFRLRKQPEVDALLFRAISLRIAALTAIAMFYFDFGTGINHFHSSSTSSQLYQL